MPWRCTRDAPEMPRALGVPPNPSLGSPPEAVRSSECPLTPNPEGTNVPPTPFGEMELRDWRHVLQHVQGGPSC